MQTAFFNKSNNINTSSAGCLETCPTAEL